jgi:hypothetical protein
MEIKISFDADHKIVFVKTFGEVDAKSSNEMTGNIFSIMRKYDARRCLIDHSDIHFVSGKTLEVYQRPAQMIKLGIPFNVRVAAIIPEEYLDHFRFLETVCNNRGIGYKTFLDKESALEWLQN